jgi:hypothetical protein
MKPDTTIIAAYRPTGREGSSIEATGSKNILNEMELDRKFKHGTKYQTKEGAVFTYHLLAGRTIGFTDGTVAIL